MIPESLESGDFSSVINLTEFTVPSELERAARELIDKADTILNTESDEPGDQYGE